MRRRKPLLLAAIALLCGTAPASAQTETIEYYGTDAVGSVRIVFNASGAVLGRQDYDPFGREILAAMGLPPERFGGQSTDDEAQQAYFHARQFQGRTGRFGSVDSVFDGMVDPQRWNRYSYVRNSALRLVDPAGLNPKTGSDQFGYSCADILKKSSHDYWCNPPSIFVIGLLPPPSSPPGRGGFGGGRGGRGHGGTGTGGTGGSGDGSSGAEAGLQIDVTVIGTAPTSDEGLQLCGGGGFTYAGIGAHAGPVHGETLLLVEYDSRYGGAHGGLVGGGVSHFSGGVESMRTWSDWKPHTTPIGLGGIEIPGGTTTFGQPISTQTRDIGGLAQFENGDLSLGLYAGATLGSGRSFGGGAYVTISSNGCHESK
jgi:RHS repeat-associated protein